MTGLPHYNRDAFMRADRLVKLSGAAYIYNPADHIDREHPGVWVRIQED